jgi:hypothetical protein
MEARPLSISAAKTDPQNLEKRRLQTAKARQAFNDRFPTPAAKSAYFSALSRESHGRRLTLPGDDAEKLLLAVALLRSISQLNNKLTQDPGPVSPDPWSQELVGPSILER